MQSIGECSVTVALTSLVVGISCHAFLLVEFRKSLAAVLIELSRRALHCRQFAGLFFLFGAAILLVLAWAAIATVIPSIAPVILSSVPAISAVWPIYSPAVVAVTAAIMLWRSLSRLSVIRVSVSPGRPVVPVRVIALAVSTLS